MSAPNRSAAYRVIYAGDVVAMVNEAITAAGSLRQLAKAWGCSPAYLCNVRLGQCPPGPLILDRFGLEVVYTPKPATTYKQPIEVSK